MELLFDPLFRVPFFTGALLAPLAAVLGAYLWLRDEWLASLSYAQVAAAGGVLAAVVHAPVLAGALLVAVLVAVAKGRLARAGNSHFALAFLLGWGAMLLAAGFSAHGLHAGQALMDGQLYFTGWPHLLAALLLALLVAALMPWLSPRLLLSRMFPDHFSANQVPAWRHHLPFDLLVVLSVAVTATAFGVVAAFALIFIPPWVAWRVAVGWRNVLLIAAGLAGFAYVVAFALAILADQPFGPVLVVALGVLALGRLLPVPGAARSESAGAAPPPRGGE